MSEHEHDQKHAPSSGTSTRDTRWMGWTLGLLAVPVVYMLTVPPVFLVEYRVSGRLYTLGEAEWVTVYCTPYGWLMQNTPLKEPLQKYLQWWLSR